MGASCCKPKRKSCRILILGLDAAGKTTILFRLKLEEKVNTIPTVGFNVEHVNFGNLELNMWDVGGQEKIRPLWRHYYAGTNGLIFVVDSNDKDRIEEARDELHKVANEREVKNAPILVFANKQDVSKCLTPEEIEEKLMLGELGHKYKVQESVATTGEGIATGLSWLSAQLEEALPWK